MRAYYSLGLLASLFLVTGEAKPCGAAFGTSYTIKPAQKIVVGYHNGIETYVFNPEFCGKADSFGLILPIPSTLTSQPKLGTAQLYTDLATVAAPTVVTTTQCPNRAAGGAPSYGQGGASSNGGTTVIQRGQVGIFDWALLQATSVSSFTEWLTNNGFPYLATATVTFQSYVDNGWYFIAFKVATGGASGAAGAAGAAATGVAGSSNTTICGSFGPVTLAFPAAPNPVIPARIASVSSSSLAWDIFAISATQMRMQGYSPTLMFSGPISAADLSSHPSLAQVAQPDDRLTELSLNALPTTDLILESDPNQADYRRVVQQVVYSSSACSTTGGVSSGGSAGKAAIGGAGGSSGKATIGGASGSSGASLGGTASGGAATGGISIGGGMPSGGLSAGGVPAGGAATGGIATGGIPTGGRPGTGGQPKTGGVPSTGGSMPTRNGGSTSVDTAQAGVPSMGSDSNTGCSCSINSIGSDATQRSLGIIGLFGAAMALGRRRRTRRRP